jgi:hypothetical protein
MDHILIVAMPATPLSTNQMDHGSVGLTVVLHKIKRPTKALNVKRSLRAKMTTTTRTTRTQKVRWKCLYWYHPLFNSKSV